jgi:hypothetical protein
MAYMVIIVEITVYGGEPVTCASPPVWVHGDHGVAAIMVVGP